MTCPMGMFAMALFYRFQDTASLSLIHRKDWYMWKALYVKGHPNDQISPASQRRLCKELERYSESLLNVDALMGRKIVAMLASRTGLDAYSVQSHSNWRRDTPSRYYFAHIAPDQVLREAQELHPKILYFIPRRDIVPPEKLQCKIFPFVERARKELEAVEAERGVNETSAHSFLNLLTELRRVFLQDLVCYRRHKIATYFAEGCPQITNDEMFLEFEERLNEHLTNIETMPGIPATESPNSANGVRHLIRSVNLIATRLANMEALNKQRHLENQEALKRMEEKLEEFGERLGERLGEKLEEMMAKWMDNERKLAKKREKLFEKRMKTVHGQNTTPNELSPDYDLTDDDLTDESDSDRGSEGQSISPVDFPQGGRSWKKRKISLSGTESKPGGSLVDLHELLDKGEVAVEYYCHGHRFK